MEVLTTPLKTFPLNIEKTAQFSKKNPKIFKLVHFCSLKGVFWARKMKIQHTSSIGVRQNPKIATLNLVKIFIDVIVFFLEHFHLAKYL